MLFAFGNVFAQDSIQARFSVLDACDKAEVVFTNTSKVPIKFGNANYFWTFGDGTTSTDQFPKHTYTLDNETTGQSFEVKLVVQSQSIPSEKDSLTDFVEIFPNPNAFFRWDVNNKGTTQDVEIDSQATTDPLNFYQWNLAGVVKSNDITPTFLYNDVQPYLDGKDYPFTLLVRTPEACETTYSTKFNYNPLSVSRVVTVTNMIYPNPSAGELKFKNSLSNIQVRNFAGQIVFETEEATSAISLDVKPGIYTVSGLQDSYTVVQKITVQ